MIENCEHGTPASENCPACWLELVFSPEIAEMAMKLHDADQPVWTEMRRREALMALRVQERVDELAPFIEAAVTTAAVMVGDKYGAAT